MGDFIIKGIKFNYGWAIKRFLTTWRHKLAPLVGTNLLYGKAAGSDEDWCFMPHQSALAPELAFEDHSSEFAENTAVLQSTITFAMFFFCNHLEFARCQIDIAAEASNFKFLPKKKSRNVWNITVKGEFLLLILLVVLQ